jgi:hypothetical protein
MDKDRNWCQRSGVLYNKHLQCGTERLGSFEVCGGKVCNWLRVWEENRAHSLKDYLSGGDREGQSDEISDGNEQ